MSDHDPTDDGFDDAPTVTCERCDREWVLDEELADLGAGNHAVEQFALDHRRHTGHFPDSVSTWRATCRNCPEETEHLSRDGATRWAETHARHTRHRIELDHARHEGTTVVDPE